MENEKIRGMLGLARRAGKTAGGAFLSEQALKKGKARLVLIAEDASENTRKQFLAMSSYRKVPVLIWGTKDVLGECTGNAQFSVLAITDSSFADAITRLRKQRF